MHRDIKAENVFLMKNDMVKLGDFGLSTQVQLGSHTVTRAGTLYYMSPEQFMERPYSFEADIWSLGILLYYLCA